MKRYSITTPSSRRKSMRKSPDRDDVPTQEQIEELERLDQETTLVLQDIDRNLAHANSIVANEILPLVQKYSSECKRVWKNAGLWKMFFEKSANVVLDTDEDTMPVGVSGQSAHLLKHPPLPTTAEEKALAPSISMNLSASSRPREARDLQENTAEHTPTWSINNMNEKFQASTPQPSGFASLVQRPLSLEDSTESGVALYRAQPLVVLLNTKSTHNLLDQPFENASKNILSPIVPNVDSIANFSPVPRPPTLSNSVKPDSADFQATLDCASLDTLHAADVLSRRSSFSPVNLPLSLSPSKPTLINDITSTLNPDLVLSRDYSTPSNSFLNETIAPVLQSVCLKANIYESRETSDGIDTGYSIGTNNASLHGGEIPSHKKKKGLNVQYSSHGREDMDIESVVTGLPQNDNLSREASDSYIRSQSMSRLFDAAVLGISKDTADHPMVETRNLFGNLARPLLNDPDSESSNKLTPGYQDKLRRLKGQFRSVQEFTIVKEATSESDSDKLD